jgi:mono/diheme cytochrome c family protein
MKYYGHIIIIIICFITISAFRQSFDLKASISPGKEVYVAQCLSCHMDEGQGIEDVYPPLAHSDYLMADKKRPIREILYGLNGPIKVNGKTYDLEMTGFDLTDQEASDVLNYIRNSWGNKGAAVTPAEVQASRTK